MTSLVLLVTLFNCCLAMFCTIGFVSGVHFKSEWASYVQLVIAQHQRNTQGPCVLSPTQFSIIWMQSQSSGDIESPRQVRKHT